MTTLLGKERLYYRCPTPQILMAAEISGKDPGDECIRNAVERALARHEMLGCRIAERSGQAFFEPAPESRAVEILREDAPFSWNAALQAEEKRVFHYEEGELCRFRVYPAEDGIVLLCSVSQAVADAEAMVLLVCDIMTALSQPGQTLGAAKSGHCDTSAVASRARLPFSLRLTMKSLGLQWNRTGKSFSPEEYEAMYDRYWSRHRTEALEYRFDVSETAALASWCSELAVSEESALGTAFLLAAEDSGIGVTFSMRDTAYTGMGNFAAGVTLNYFPGVDTGFAERVREFHAQLTAKLHDPSAAGFQLKFMDSVPQSLIDGAYFAAYGAYANPAAQRAAVLFGFRSSSKGVHLMNPAGPSIPAQYGSYRLRALSFVPPLVPGSERLVGAVTHDGQLSVTMHYDAERSEEMHACFNRAIQTLKRQTVHG